MTTQVVASDDLSRFQGEDNLEAPGAVAELIHVPLAKVARTERETQRMRRQVYELTLDDLAAFPVWEFRLDEQDQEGRDESTVRPYKTSSPLDPADRMFIVRAVFTLADGSRMRGYFTPPDRGDAGIGSLQPTIVTERGQVRLWCGTAAPGPKRLAQNYQFLGKDQNHIFPVQFESDVELVGGPVKGIAPGFLVLENFQTRQTRTVT